MFAAVVMERLSAFLLRRSQTRSCSAVPMASLSFIRRSSSSKTGRPLNKSKAFYYAGYRTATNGRSRSRFGPAIGSLTARWSLLCSAKTNAAFPTSSTNTRKMSTNSMLT